MNKNNIIVLIVVIVVIAGIIIFIQNPFANKDVIETPSGEMIEVGIIDPVEPTTPQTGIEIGDQAPNFRLENFNGQIIELTDLRGTPVMIDFWANWCPFCHTEFPEIEKAWQEYKDQGLQVYGIHRTDTENVKTGLNLINETGATFPLLKDATGDVYNTYSGGRYAMPLTVYIDSNGIIRDKSIGPKTLEQIKAGISTIIN